MVTEVQIETETKNVEELNLIRMSNFNYKPRKQSNEQINVINCSSWVTLFSSKDTQKSTFSSQFFLYINEEREGILGIINKIPKGEW